MRDRLGEKDANLRAFLDLLFASTVRVSASPKVFVTVCKTIHRRVGDFNRTAVEEDDADGTTNYEIISKNNVSVVLDLVLIYLDVILDGADAIISRL